VSGARRVGAPVQADVHADPQGLPLAIGAAQVETVREEWVVEDLWWAGTPLRRRYFELVLADGRNVVVFRDLEAGDWFSQRA
jgi:hypothetical protein